MTYTIKKILACIGLKDIFFQYEESEFEVHYEGREDSFVADVGAKCVEAQVDGAKLIREMAEHKLDSKHTDELKERAYKYFDLMSDSYIDALVIEANNLNIFDKAA